MLHSFEFVKNRVDEVGYFICRWDQLSASELFNLKDEIELFLFYEYLKSNGLDTLPKIVRVGDKYSIATNSKGYNESNIVFCRQHSPLDKSDENEAKALFTVKLAAIMAKIDGRVEHEEIIFIQNTIDSLSYLKETKKYSVFIRGLFFMQQKFIREDLVFEFSKLGRDKQVSLINIMKSIVVADGYVDKSERKFLAELYRASGRAANNLTKDLYRQAKLNGISIAKRQETENTSLVLTESYEGSLLEDLIYEFMEF